MQRDLCVRVAAIAALSLALVLSSPAGGAVLVHESGGFGGQRGAEMNFGSMSDPGWIRHYSTWPDAENDEIHLDSVTEGEAFVKTLQEATIDLDGSNLSIWQHGRVQSESYPWPLGTAYKDWYVGSWSGNQAHADAVSQNLSFRIEPEADESIGDPVQLTFNANLAVNHRLNSVVYHDWTSVDIGSDGSTDYEMKGQLDGGWPNPYTVFLTPSGTSEAQVGLQADDWYTYSTNVFHNEVIEAHIGDLVTFEGGPLVWQTVDTSTNGNEEVVSDIQFSIDLNVAASSNGSSAVVVDLSFDNLGDFDETGFDVGSQEGSGTATLLPDLVGDIPDNMVARLYDAEGPMWISRTIECMEELDIDLEYWFPSEGKLTILLDGVELTSVESMGDPPAFSPLSESFVLADYGLSPGELLLELKLSNPWDPDPELYLDNMLVSTAPEPGTAALLLCGLAMLRRRMRG
jgi:hypothetical protein